MATLDYESEIHVNNHRNQKNETRLKKSRLHIKIMLSDLLKVLGMVVYHEFILVRQTNLKQNDLP